MELLGSILAGVIPGVVAMVLGYFIWVKTRGKKLSWVAFIWQESDAKFSVFKKKEGILNAEISVEEGAKKLSRLQLYARDVLIRDERSKGNVIFRLVSLNKTVGEPTPDTITVMPNVGKVVNVMYKGDTCTLLRNGYDSESGEKIWQPLPYDRYNALKNDMGIQLERVQQRKDLLAQLLPYVAIVIAFMAIIGLGYMAGSSQVKVAKENRVAAEMLADAYLQSAELYRDAAYVRVGLAVPVPPPPVVEDGVPGVVAPSIE